LWLGHNATGSGTLRLNGGLLQTLNLQPSSTPATSVAYFNGGTLQAVTNSTDFIAPGTTTYVQSGGLVFDDAGYAINLLSASLQEDAASTGGGLVKQGAGTLYMDNGANNYTGTTRVLSGTLAGIGALASPVVVSPTGNIGAGDETAIGILTINNTLTLQGRASMRVMKTGGFPTSDQFLGITTANYGGTLVVTNTGTEALAVGDKFNLFPATAHTGNFAAIIPSPGYRLAYSFDPASGVLSVVPLPSTPTTLVCTPVVGPGGTSLQLSWPANYLGWLVQSNAVDVTTPAAWQDIPGSDAATSLTIPINPAQPQVYYRVRYP
jgi:autotransporter-associated beta strand protein